MFGGNHGGINLKPHPLQMRQFLAVLVFAGCLIHGAIGATYCTIDDDIPLFSAPDLNSRVVTLVKRNTCFHGVMEGKWLVLQDNPENINIL
ncbi:hypothetical protein DPMN_003865 [Dreissena polymorpha]|uniref:Uncharacterized protein n=1 Tax=Dreissena polymorpha TaxID=45954 RepID=A0A9D4MQI1_DREPO|nr:hypothetical protein DPMN_003865 [Dreissena polymorpha]